MRTSARSIAIAFAVGACFAPLGAHAFDSGSTGVDGAYTPTVSAPLALPPSGIFNFTSVNIPAGVTITVTRNTTNTPAVFLASGSVTIAGTLTLSGGSSAATGAAGGGAQGDDGTPGLGGPGGFDGGRGGRVGSLGSAITPGGGGLGPGGGQAGIAALTNQIVFGGGGGGFNGAGANNNAFACGYTAASHGNVGGIGGANYGSGQLLPLIGGSGGGGGVGGLTFEGSGGGGGGGAILIAASGTVSISGALTANGGAAGQTQGGGANAAGGAGGGGSGGAIRIVATTIAGNGTISAVAGGAGTSPDDGCKNGGAGATGRVRLEGETITRTAATTPVALSDLPGPVFVAGTPTLRIASVAGVSTPESPTGNADVTLPASTPNPVTVVFTTTGVPVGNTVSLTVTPAFGNKTTAVTPALVGDTSSATASASVNLPVGPSVLSAQTTYTVVAAVGDLLKNFAGNERVEKVTLMATLGGPSKAMLTTVSGKQYEVPAEVLRIAALGGRG
jgi:hypothetical protein